MDLQSIQDHLVSEAPEFQAGRNLFIYSMPSSVQIGTVILSEMSNAYADHEVPGLFYNPFQVVVRHRDYLPGQELANQIYDTLNLRRTTLGQYHFLYILPKHLPMPYRRGDSDLMEFSINFKAKFVMLL